MQFLRSTTYGVKLASMACLVAITSNAATLHVSRQSTNPVPPYATWATAATNIQHAIDAANSGDLVLVTNGVYSPVSITKQVHVLSVNGAAWTTIIGSQSAPTARCAYLANGASLSGFTLTNGHDLNGGGAYCETIGEHIFDSVITGNVATDDGGGVWGGTLSGCTIIGNIAHGDGGGVDRAEVFQSVITRNKAERGGGVDDSTLYGCIISENEAQESGGGTLQSTLYNCTVTANKAHRNGGVASKWFNGETAYNCIIYGNHAAVNPNYGEDERSKVLLKFCCTTPLPALGEGNIDVDPLLLSGGHIAAASPCIGVGSPSFAPTVDVDGQPYETPPSIGADEPVAGTRTGPIAITLAADHLKVVPGFTNFLAATMEGFVTSNFWSLGDGSTFANRREVNHAWNAPGTFAVVFTAFNDSHPAGISATVTVQVATAPTYYVNASNTAPAFPFTSWATAATNIQDAVNAGDIAGRRVLVTDGVYASGGTAVFGAMSNRVALLNGVRVESVNGPSVTTIRGAPLTSGNNGVRGAYVAHGSILHGFTLTEGSTLNTGSRSKEQGGGGAWSEKRGVLVNCIISTNYAFVDGGGVHGGTLFGCQLLGNHANDDGGGADSSTLVNCLLEGNSAGDGGGGADESVLYRCGVIANQSLNGGGTDDSTLSLCIIRNNEAMVAGGVGESVVARCRVLDNGAMWGAGALGGILKNCVIAGNTASEQGGGASLSTVWHCTVVSNRVTGSGSGGFYGGGGVWTSFVENCIVYYNEAVNGPNWTGVVGPAWITISNTCTFPLPPSGTGNIDSPPAFADFVNYRLAAGSPCIDAGSALSPLLPMDLDGNPRPTDGNGDGIAVPDMGAYEFQAPRITSILRLGNAVRITWAGETNLRLQRTTSFTNAWTDVPGTLGASQAELPITTGNEFFRLLLP